MFTRFFASFALPNLQQRTKRQARGCLTFEGVLLQNETFGVSILAGPGQSSATKPGQFRSVALPPPLEALPR
jgi:hypothetical protein